MKTSKTKFKLKLLYCLLPINLFFSCNNFDYKFMEIMEMSIICAKKPNSDLSDYFFPAMIEIEANEDISKLNLFIENKSFTVRRTMEIKSTGKIKLEEGKVEILDNQRNRLRFYLNFDQISKFFEFDETLTDQCQLIDLANLVGNSNFYIFENDLYHAIPKSKDFKFYLGTRLPIKNQSDY